MTAPVLGPPNFRASTQGNKGASVFERFDGAGRWWLTLEEEPCEKTGLFFVNCLKNNVVFEKRYNSPKYNDSKVLMSFGIQLVKDERTYFSKNSICS